MGAIPSVTIYCAGPPDNDGNPTHERYEIGTYERIDPNELTAVEPGCCWSCGEPSTSPPCSRCGAGTVEEAIGPSVTHPVWFVRDEWTDPSGKVRRARALVRDIDGYAPKGHPNHMRSDEYRTRTDQRTQVRIKCDMCGLDEQRNGTIPAAVLNLLVDNGMLEISAYGLIGVMKQTGLWS